MKTLGIIVEYNPLHNGHVLHYKQSKQVTGAEAAIAVMSGPFLQRGEPAVAGKRARTEMALAMGVDLVIELPVTYAVQPAEWFAYGAVSLLESTGVVDTLAFGSESGTLNDLLPLAAVLSEGGEELKQEISARLSAGMPFPKAYAMAAAAVSGNSPEEAEELAGMLAQPNNSLGLHYLIALRRLNSSIVPYTITRESAMYHDLQPATSTIASATSIRKLISEKGLHSAAPYVPDYTLEIMQREFSLGQAVQGWNSFRQPLFHTLLTHAPEELEAYLEVTEGLQHRIRKVLPRLTAPDVESLLEALKTKRYTRTKLQRMLVHILLGHGKEEMSPVRLSEGPGYIRVLGFSGKGRELLKRMKKTASLPVVTRPSAFEHPQLRRDIEASAVYANACAHPETAALFHDYLLPPVTL